MVDAIDQQPVKLGWRSALAFGEETDYAEGGTPDRSFEFRSEGLALQQERIESEAIRASEFQPRWGAGTRGVEGDVTFELANKGFGLIFKHALGDVSTEELTAGESWRHVFTPGDLSGLSLAAQVIRDDVPFDYTGLKVQSLALECAVGDIATLTASLVGRDEATDGSAHTPAFPSGLDLLTFVHGAVLLGDEGAEDEIPVSTVSLTLENGLETDRRRLGSGLRRNPQRTAYRDLTGSFEADFTDLSLYQRFVSGDEARLVLRFVGGEIGSTGDDYGLEIVTNVRFDGETPTVGGPDEIRQSMEWKAFPSDAVPDTVEVAYTTDDETP